MMGFGFVVARFGLWLRALAAAAPAEPPSHSHLSAWFGFALVLLGVAANAVAAVRHRRYVRDLDAGIADPALDPMLVVALAAVLAAIGLAMAAYVVIAP